MRFFIIIVAFIFPFFINAQSSKLAQQYYQDGEYEKAAAMYQKLSDQHKNNDFYFDRFIESLLMLEDYTKVEDIIKKRLKENPKNVKLYVTYGNLYERQFMDAEATEQYQKAIKKLPADRFAITKLASAFTTLTKYEMAIETYERGSDLINDKEIFAYNLAELYRRKGDVPKMITNYLNSLESNPNRLNSIKSQFTRYIREQEDFEELQAQLYERIQTNRDNVQFPELLTWLFIQQKDYRGAFRQVKALDRRLGENGGRINRLAQIAANDGDYDSAIMAYDYIVEEKGPISTYYVEAKEESLRARRNKLILGFEYTEVDLRALEAAYESFLAEFGRDRRTASMVSELADLEALYLNDIEKAISLLEEMINYPAVDPKVQAFGKLSLGDYYLISGERWEATLLYSQVDKAFGEDLLGHEARYKNAKLSYFFGDFQWAQAQFDVLKASTSKLIANDALDLSVFIMDNMGLDTTEASLKLYSDAELLIFRNKYEEAFTKLDTLVQRFPEHTLEDDVYYAKAQIFKRQREYQKAEEMYNKIIENFPEEIRADNSLYELAELYELHLGDLEKAKELYQTLFIDYSGSTFAVEARKKFRKLRGDDI
ncbi:MAG: tetratricopeptide repeat protein [Saprospiraceae bacterium]|jgi:tetratricopeptide (TPR) repeat protein|nr:tetratricopeptide repeat protein [Saprospiraceae bacterium]